MEMAGPWAGGCEQRPPWCLTTAGPPAPSSHPPPPSTFGKIVLRPEEGTGAVGLGFRRCAGHE